MYIGFLYRPHIPFLQQVPPDVLLASARNDPLMGADGIHAQMQRAPTPLTKTIQTQTDYRDGEAQTDPYSPEYVVRPGSQPELLTLATLSYGMFAKGVICNLCVAEQQLQCKIDI